MPGWLTVCNSYCHDLRCCARDRFFPSRSYAHGMQSWLALSKPVEHLSSSFHTHIVHVLSVQCEWLLYPADGGHLRVAINQVIVLKIFPGKRSREHGKKEDLRQDINHLEAMYVRLLWTYSECTELENLTLSRPRFHNLQSHTVCVTVSITPQLMFLLSEQECLL